MYVVIAILSGILIVTIFNAFTAPMLKNAPKPKYHQKVSVLVPARNEERNIAACLEGLLSQDYSDFEVIVLNDHSQDLTVEIVERFCEKDPRVRLLEGQELPPGWTGKNWACHQLSQEANSEILIFTDADNRHIPVALANTVGWMQKLKLGLFSAFPQQITSTLSENLVVPVIDMFVYSGLPLWLTYYTLSPHVAAANGQWIAFTRHAYDHIGGHLAVRDQMVEDVELSRLAKRENVRILTAAGTGVVFGQMYHSIREVWEGFSKNIFGLTGYKTVLFFIIVLVLLYACVMPYLMIWIRPFSMMAATAITLNVFLRLILSLKYKHPVFTGVVLHPVAVLFTVIIGLNSFLRFKTGCMWWKGRKIDIRSSG